MPRALSSDMLAAIQAANVLPAIFLTATFMTGPIYVWSGLGPIVWNGETWQGLGTLAGISAAEEGATVQPRGITLSLSGIDSTLLADILGEFQTGAPVTAYLGLFAGTPPALIADPAPIWAGRMDQPTIDVDGQTASITINCENRLIELNNSVDRRLTNDDQQLVAPGDQGLSFALGIQEMMLYWGTKSSNPLNI